MSQRPGELVPLFSETQSVSALPADPCGGANSESSDVAVVNFALCDQSISAAEYHPAGRQHWNGGIAAGDCTSAPPTSSPVCPGTAEKSCMGQFWVEPKPRLSIEDVRKAVVGQKHPRQSVNDTTDRWSRLGAHANTTEG
ncbi:hypothetical protein CYMTET_21484 [Cymbomonas tetramitiformis]|uniref:Uncharacterized protein n=1 Tax=Cymbomonas tetramitiformis TaxID=36881 RepID=A0AAE0G1X8_9CHLO|nr:hypothetical protein CYMTET_21484 [Cymbomonas tetramitiformis]